MLLIGSRATKIHFPTARKPKDYDFIATSKEVDEFLSKFSYRDTSHHPKKRRAMVDIDGKGHHVSFEFDLVEKIPSSKFLYEHDKKFVHTDAQLGITYHVACPQTLFLLKRSHIVFNIHWEKNIRDYTFLRTKIADTAFPLWWEEAYTLRFNEVKTRLGKREMNFDVDNSEFFKRSEKYVGRKVEHDSLHYATCFHDKPLFLSAKDDVSKAALSERKVRQMDRKLKIEMIQEECMALSLERYIIPSLLSHQPYNASQAYHQTACRMVYHYLPMFLRHFAADNFQEILDLPCDYVAKCLKKHPSLKKMINETV